MVIYIPYLLNELGIHAPRLAGLLSALGSSVLIVASLVYPLVSARINGHHLLALAFCIGAAGCLIMTFAMNWQVVAVGNVIMAAGIGLISPTTMDMVLDYSRSSIRGQATGMMMTGNYIGMFIAPVGIAQTMHMGLPLSQIYGLLALLFIVIGGLGGRIGWDTVPAVQIPGFCNEILERE